jgi:hypothetical protein
LNSFAPTKGHNEDNHFYGKKENTSNKESTFVALTSTEPKTELEKDICMAVTFMKLFILLFSIKL